MLRVTDREEDLEMGGGGEGVCHSGREEALMVHGNVPCARRHQGRLVVKGGLMKIIEMPLPE